MHECRAEVEAPVMLQVLLIAREKPRDRPLHARFGKDSSPTVNQSNCLLLHSEVKTVWRLAEPAHSRR